MNRYAAGRLQPLLEAFVADAGHHSADQTAFRLTEIDGFAGATRFATDARQCLLARAAIGQDACSRVEDRAENLAKARPLVLHAGLRRRDQHQRRCVRRVGNQRRGCAGGERMAASDHQPCHASAAQQWVGTAQTAGRVIRPAEQVTCGHRRPPFVQAIRAGPDTVPNRASPPATG